VPDFGLTDRRLASADAFEEIAHVIVADIQALGTRRQLLLEKFGLAGLDFLAVDEDPALAAFEPHALAFVGLLDLSYRSAVEILGGDRPARERDAIGVGVFDLIPGRGRVPPRDRLLQYFSLDGYRARAFGSVGPLGDVIMMRAPVSDRPAGVVVPET